MISRFDTYSEIMHGLLYGLSGTLNIRNVSNFNIWGRIFWLESLKIAYIYVVGRYETIIPI